MTLPSDLLPQGNVDARRILGVLWKWKWLIAAGAVGGAGIGAIDVLQRRPVFQATTQVLVERQGPKLLKFVDQDGWVIPPDVPYDTHARLMRTSPIAARVAKARTAELAAHPAYRGAIAQFATATAEERTDGVPNALVDALLGGLATRPSRDELGIVDVTYTSLDAKLSASLANAFAQEYIDARLEASLGLNKNVTDWVDARLAEQRVKLADADAALQRYRETHSWVGSQKAPPADRVAKMRETLDEVSRAREETERRGAQIRLHQKSLDDASAVAEVSESKLFQEQAALRNALLLKVVEADARGLGPKHPDMLKLRADLDAAEKALAREIDRLGRATTLELDRIRTHERDLRASLDAATKEAVSESARATEFAALEREVELNRQLYDGLLRRLKQLGLAMDADRSNIRVVELARVPGSPLATRSAMAMLQAFAAGLLFAAGVAFLWEWADSTVKGPEELETGFRLPVLGVVPSIAGAPNGHGRADLNAPILVDAFGALRSAVILSAPESAPQALVVTSPGAGEGKSTVAMHLASAFARDGVPTLLVEADLRHPVLHSRLGIANVPGLTELLTSRQPLAPVVRKTSVDGLFLLPSGSPAPNPGELLGSSRMTELIAEARKSYGRIVIDSPPVFAAAEMLALADSTVLAAACDGVVLVVRSRHTTRQALARARSRLLTVHARFLGAVLNDWRRPGPSSRTRYYEYGYETTSPLEPAVGDRPAGSA